jgi:hypothetical protein
MDPNTTLQKFNELFFVLEDLLKRIADSDDPNIRRMRAKVRAELVAIQGDISKTSLVSPPLPEAPRKQDP